MMIACLGWGSLIWDARGLPIRGKWFDDGPLLPVEFVRQSSDGRLTLVLVPDAVAVRSLWAPFSVPTVAEAREALRQREGVRKENINAHIAVWTAEDVGESNPPSIGLWARSLGLHAVIWTALPPRFDNVDGKVPSSQEAVNYLRGLPHEQRQQAERYIRMAPRQVDTLLRRTFEREFGWTTLATS